MNKLFGILFATCLLGCGQGSGNWKVYLDPNFNDQEQSLVREGISNWEVCTKGVVSFEYTKEWRQDHDFILISPSTIQELTVATDNDETDTLGHCSSDGTVNNIEIAVNQPPWNFLQTLMHEAGHSQGLQHSDPGTLMYKSQDGAADHITHGDLQQFCSLWSCNPEKSACW